MTEIEKTEAEIKVLEKQLELLKSIKEHHNQKIKEAYKVVYGSYPVLDVSAGDWDVVTWEAFQKGYMAAIPKAVPPDDFQPTPQTPEQVADGLRAAMKQAKEDGVFEEPSKPMDEVVERLVKKYQAQKLYNRVYDELGYSYKYCNEIVDLVEDWLPEPQSAAGSQNVNTELLVDGFNDCVRKMKEMLR